MINKKQNILVTGGAGFIGSNIAEALLADERVGKVRVLDNLANGFLKNIKELLVHPDFEFIEGDIRDYNICLDACNGMDLISHQAALGSVPRSIIDPMTTNDVNIGGTLNIFKAAIEKKVKRVVFAASSSTYGDNNLLPKVEENIGNPISPYGITKYVNELYADVFSNIYNGFEYIGLRYFNVFGPKQDPNGAYAAVVPLFIKKAILKEQAVINGDGTFSRDFTFVANAVQANIKSLFSTSEDVLNEIFNVACGQQTSLNELWAIICQNLNITLDPIYGPNRDGDIPHSLADISKVKSLLGYSPQTLLEEGIIKTIEYYKNA